jgi:hypothetical protein
MPMLLLQVLCLRVAGPSGLQDEMVVAFRGTETSGPDAEADILTDLYALQVGAWQWAQHEAWAATTGFQCIYVVEQWWLHRRHVDVCLCCCFDSKPCSSCNALQLSANTGYSQAARHSCEAGVRNSTHAVLCRYSSAVLCCAVLQAHIGDMEGVPAEKYPQDVKVGHAQHDWSHTCRPAQETRVSLRLDTPTVAAALLICMQASQQAQHKHGPLTQPSQPATLQLSSLLAASHVLPYMQQLCVVAPPSTPAGPQGLPGVLQRRGAAHRQWQV